MPNSLRSAPTSGWLIAATIAREAWRALVLPADGVSQPHVGCSRPLSAIRHPASQVIHGPGQLLGVPQADPAPERVDHLETGVRLSQRRAKQRPIRHRDTRTRFLQNPLGLSYVHAGDRLCHRSPLSIRLRGYSPRCSANRGAPARRALETGRDAGSVSGSRPRGNDPRGIPKTMATWPSTGIRGSAVRASPSAPRP